jgi:diadenosine tetraphosphate (Ap4A) HIT family hydrolase
MYDAAISKRNVFANTHFCIEPCGSCAVTGYLIVSPLIRVSSLAELSPEAQGALGATLAAATRSIEIVVRPERVYCALFAEESAAVHFHLFPRTRWLLSSYSHAHPEDVDISGPRLLDWARSTFHIPPTPEHEKATEEIFRVIRQMI